jgi:hypothetical protein
MLRNLIHLVVLSTLVGLSATASGQIPGLHSLSDTEVLALVRAFEGDPALPVRLISRPAVGSLFDPHEVYKLEAGHYSYHARDGILARYDETFGDKAAFYGQNPDPELLKTQAMSQEDAHKIALRFMEAHYPEPSLLGSLHVYSREHMSGKFIEMYNFDFRQDLGHGLLGHGVLGPSFCTVDVDAVKGEVVNYFSSHFPVLISPTPRLSPQQAMEAAMETLLFAPGQPGEVNELVVSKPDALG